MNKTQFYTLSGALLASTALSGAANAGTIGRFDATTGNFSTTPLTVANTVFSTTASDANAIVIGGNGDAGFGIRYANLFSGSTRWTTEFTLTGARFITAGLSTNSVQLLHVTANGSVVNSVTGAQACANINNLLELFVVEDCHSTGNGANGSGTIGGLVFTGVIFNNASGLATAGSTVSLAGVVRSATNTSQIFEASSSGTIITSANPFQVNIVAGADATASTATTPAAFTALTGANTLSFTLATVRLSATGALLNNLSQTVGVLTHANTTNISVTSSILSSASVRSVSLVRADDNTITTLSNLTAANFSGGTVTFTVNNATVWTATRAVSIAVSFMGTTAIPAAVAGTVAATVFHAATGVQGISASGVTAAVTQGGFRAEVNTFNASTNGPFGSYLRIHNNGTVAGTVTISVRSDDHTSGAILGSSFTTAAIQPGSTMQLSAAEMEGTATSTKLPAGGANVPTASRVGSYTINVTGPIVGYVQHILFDGNSVADLSSYRNSGNTNNQP